MLFQRVLSIFQYQTVRAKFRGFQSAEKFACLVFFFFLVHLLELGKGTWGWKDIFPSQSSVPNIWENWERLEFIYTLICALCVFPWHKCMLHYNFMLRSLCWRIMISYLNYSKPISLFLLWNIYWIIYFYLCGYLSDIHRDHKRALDPLELELQIVVSNGVGAWSWTQVLCRFS